MAAKDQRLLPNLKEEVEFAGGEVFACELTDDRKAEVYMQWARDAFETDDLDEALFFVQAAQVHATLAVAKAH